MRGRQSLHLMAVLGIAACSRDASDRPAQRVPDNQAPIVTLTGAPDPRATDSTPPAPPVDSVAALPSFAAGVYDLVAVRDEPLLDDAGRARDAVERALPWDALDTAAEWKDSLRILQLFLERPDEEQAELNDADSAYAFEVAQRAVEKLACIEWRSGGSLKLESDGSFAIENRYRKYCRGKNPAYTVRRDSLQSVLAKCEDPADAPAVGRVPHVTCRFGRYWDGVYNYRHVGDTLMLSTDCDGRDTYVLRQPKRPTRRLASSDAVMRTADEC